MISSSVIKAGRILVSAVFHAWCMICLGGFIDDLNYVNVENMLHPGDRNIFIRASIKNPSWPEVGFYILFHALHDPPVQVLSHNYPRRFALPE